MPGGVAAVTTSAQRAARIAARLHAVADNLAAGRRETPQRFIPLGAAVAADVDARLRLIHFLLAEVVAEAEGEEGEEGEVAALCRRVAESFGPRRSADAGPTEMLAGAILDAAPRLSRRRSIHCHGWMASDRRLLLLREVLDESRDRRRGGDRGPWLLCAYAISDYGGDHFRMLGPRVERRVRRLAGWVETSLARQSDVT